jgi:hypothetical protein
MACKMLSRCARSCGGASSSSFFSLVLVDRRPNRARMGAGARARAERAAEPEVAGEEAEAAARRARKVDAAEVAAPAAARRIRSGVQVASPAPEPAMSAAVPASGVLRPTAEPARLDRVARPAALVTAAAPRARAVPAARPAPAGAEALPVERAGRGNLRCAARAHARAANSACAPAAAGRLSGAIRFPMAASVRPDGPIGPSATPHRRPGQAARSRRARRPLLSAPPGPRRAAPRSPAVASRRTSVRAAGDAV